jgi:tetratricopeptide (TPR) repeat protein
MYRVLCLLAAVLAVVSHPRPGQAQAQDDTTVCFSLGSQNYSKPEFYDRGIQACTRLFSVRTGKLLAEAYGARGVWQTKKKNYDAALADFNHAISLDSANVELWDYRADVWLEKGQVDRAISDYQQAIRIRPTYAAAYYSLGRAYEKKGQVGRARDSYKKALAAPKNYGGVSQRIQDWAQRNAQERLAELDKPRAR